MKLLIEKNVYPIYKRGMSLTRHEENDDRMRIWHTKDKTCLLSSLVIHLNNNTALSVSLNRFTYLSSNLIKVGGLENSSLILTATNDVLLKHFRLGLDGVGRLSV